MGADAPELPSSPSRERLITAALLTGLVSATVVLLLFAWLGREVLHGETVRLDTQLRSDVHALANPTLTRVMVAASVFGSPGRLVPVGIVIAIGLALRGWLRGAVLLVVNMAGAELIDGLLKPLYARIRPAAFYEFYPLPSSFSFPSGHALFAICFFGGLAVLLSPRIQRRPLRVALWLAAGAAIVLISVSRVYLGVHYPTDVLGGLAAGFTWVTAVAVGDRVATRFTTRRAAPSWRATRSS